jgi:hypothetical protein
MLSVHKKKPKNPVVKKLVQGIISSSVATRNSVPVLADLSIKYIKLFVYNRVRTEQTSQSYRDESVL